MGDDRLLITDVSSRVLAHEIADKYGLWLGFGSTSSAEVAKTGVMRVFWKNMNTKLDTLSADKFNSMTVQDLEDMCEYWKMVGVFGHG